MALNGVEIRNQDTIPLRKSSWSPYREWTEPELSRNGILRKSAGIKRWSEGMALDEGSGLELSEVSC